jgi:TonB family protein
MTSLQQSFLYHFLLVAVFVFITYFSPRAPQIDQFEVELVDLSTSKMNPEPPKAVDIRVNQKTVAPTQPIKEVNKVYGLHRQAYTEEIAEKSPESVEIKAGNTLAKEVDEQTLKETDPDELPTPTEEYLITELPKIISEYKIPYPPKAKKMEIAGKVIVDILIDQNGIVRQSSLVKGLGFGLDEAALEGVRQYRFSPAKVGVNSVAVKIRYAINFILE